MNNPSVSRNLKKFQKKAGLPQINLHSLRHTHCSLLFEAGVGMEVVKERLGHSNIETTMDVYTHVTTKRHEDTARIFAESMEIS
ncbi:site-specific integrase [Hutsoniella sourekii]|uniref:site-specific integrase n=1 Tax=Hutsoniella sourekii TaxID=87650 RepID=UPI000688330C|nr:site-specific integrase [Hutsoniella sourekii]